MKKPVKKQSSKAQGRFRISALNIRWISIDTEPTKSVILKGASIEYEDIVVTAQNEDGSQFEISRVSAPRDAVTGAGSATSVATLVCARSWGNETDNDSVSCPLCSECGHGAKACTSKETR